MTEQLRPAGTSPAADQVDEVTRALLTGSRLLLALSTRALAAGAGDRVTLAQFRMLAALAERGHVKLVALAGLMAVNPSTAMRMVDRLIAAGLADRRPNPANRRETVLTATAAGLRLVEEVTARRRAEVAAVVARMEPEQRAALVAALTAFIGAGGEPEADEPYGAPRPLGWTEPYVLG
ncbi:MarR family transcriptional regulator [Streptomyces sp. NPDC087917]|uniref:MarR family winged helix-turn-helix transcriptional regulator n=1 Tax=unclassified Streptomyces TaxID=2593676 RepID=UPI003448E36F